MKLEKIRSRHGRNSLGKKSPQKYNKKTKYMESRREQIKLKAQSKESKMESSKVVNRENKGK